MPSPSSSYDFCNDSASVSSSRSRRRADAILARQRQMEEMEAAARAPAAASTAEWSVCGGDSSSVASYGGLSAHSGASGDAAPVFDTEDRALRGGRHGAQDRTARAVRSIMRGRGADATMGLAAAELMASQQSHQGAVSSPDEPERSPPSLEGGAYAEGLVGADGVGAVPPPPVDRDAWRRSLTEMDLNDLPDLMAVRATEAAVAAAAEMTVTASLAVVDGGADHDRRHASCSDVPAQGQGQPPGLAGQQQRRSSLHAPPMGAVESANRFLWDSEEKLAWNARRDDGGDPDDGDGDDEEYHRRDDGGSSHPQPYGLRTGGAEDWAGGTEDADYDVCGSRSSSRRFFGRQHGNQDFGVAGGGGGGDGGLIRNVRERVMSAVTDRLRPVVEDEDRGNTLLGRLSPSRGIGGGAANKAAARPKRPTLRRASEESAENSAAVELDIWKSVRGLGASVLARGGGSSGGGGGAGDIDWKESHRNLAPRRPSKTALDFELDLDVDDVEYDYTDGVYGGPKKRGWRRTALTAVSRCCPAKARAACASTSLRGVALFWVIVVALVLTTWTGRGSGSERGGETGAADPWSFPTGGGGIADIPWSDDPNRLESIRSRLILAGVSLAEALSDPFVSPDGPGSSPQRWALEWVSFRDPAQMDPADPALFSRYALAAFFFATNGGSQLEVGWGKSDGWLSEESVCGWYGVTCSGGGGKVEGGGTKPGMVIGLNVTSNGLKGTVTREIMMVLTELKVLDLSYNSIGGTLPEEVGELENLESLYIVGTEMTGSLPSALGRLFKLRSLFCASSLFRGTIPHELANIKGLENLGLDENQLTGSIPDNFVLLEKLGVLYLDDNMLTSTIPEHIGRLERLRDLRLRRNELTGSIPSSVEGLGKLRLLYLDNNALTSTIPDVFDRNSFPLQDVQLYNNKLSGTLPPSIGALGGSLHTLYLDHNDLTGQIPDSWSDLKVLKELYLHRNTLSGTIPLAVARMTSLVDLALQHNELTGTLLQQLDGLTSLVSITVESNQLTGSIFTDFGRLINLETLNIYRNSFTGEVPENICALKEKKLTQLGADCAGGDAKIQCICCDKCY